MTTVTYGFQEMEKDGLVGEVAEIAYGFMGFIPQPEGLVQESAPEVAKLLRQAGVDAVLIGTT